MAETASTALHNASLLMAERKVEILETLVTVSHEITSTLNLERMLQTIVNAPQAVIPYERAAIALETARQIQAERGDRPDAGECRRSRHCAAERHPAVGGAFRRSNSRAAGGRRGRCRARGNARKICKLLQRNRHARFLFHAAQRRHRPRRRSVPGKRRSGFSFSGAHRNSAGAGRTGYRGVAQRANVQGSAVHFRARAGAGTKTQIHGHGKKTAHLDFDLVAAGRNFSGDFSLAAAGGRGLHRGAGASRSQVQPEIEGVVGKVYVREGQVVSRGEVLAEMEAWDYRSALAVAEAKIPDRGVAGESFAGGQ